MGGISRRAWLKAAGASAAFPVAVRAAPAPSKAPGKAQAAPSPAFLTPPERACIEAAVARLIPSDETGPGAIEAGVPDFIDRQLGGAWGAGERLYRSGPWHAGTPQQGYQLPFTPAQLFRNALRGLDDDTRRSRGKAFAQLTAQEQDAALHDIERSDRDFNGVPANVFFDSLLAMTLEGYFSDPVYGGNRDMAAWRMIGFPGAHANYYNLVDQHNLAFVREPMSLAESGNGEVHMHPQIPAYAPPLARK
jgi:gluconate 2-dehydrogenase gamma chain